MGSTLVATKSEEKKSTASARQDVDHNALLLQHAIGVPAGLPRFLSGGTAGGDGTTGGMRREPVPPDAPLPLDQAKSELEDGKTREAKPASGALAQARAAPASDAGRRDGAAGRRTPTPPTRVGGGARTA